MLNTIVDISLRYKVLVLVGFLLVVAFGVQAFRTVPVDAFPDVTPVQVNIYTESPGLAAEDVEKLLTFPVETSVAGLPGVEDIRSVSLFGLGTGAGILVHRRVRRSEALHHGPAHPAGLERAAHATHRTRRG